MMEIEIISFGKIATLLSNQRMHVPDICTTDEFRAYLENSFPELQGMKYKLALNAQMVQGNRSLTDHDVVALMPPFSGG